MRDLRAAGRLLQMPSREPAYGAARFMKLYAPTLSAIKEGLTTTDPGRICLTGWRMPGGVAAAASATVFTAQVKSHCSLRNA